MTLGLPLNLFDAVGKAIYLLYDGVRFAWIADGEIANINFPTGGLKAEDGEIYISESAEIGICGDISALESEEKTEVKNESIVAPKSR